MIELPEQIFYDPFADGNTATLGGDEFRHAVRSLRLGLGDSVALTNGKGSYFYGRIQHIGKEEATIAIEQTADEERDYYKNIHVAVAPTKKPDRMEWMVEKLVEIGIGSILFFSSQRTERQRLKMERVEKIAISALKQSKRATLPVISSLSMVELLSKTGYAHKVIATLSGAALPFLSALQPSLPALILIGPEGGFSEEEVEAALAKGFSPCSLGEARLRTETAAIVACTTLNLITIK